VTERHFLYVIGRPESAPYKIGRSTDVYQRYMQLQSGSPDLLCIEHLAEVPPKDAVAAEKLAHELVAPYRLHGEWFHITSRYAAQTIEEAARRVNGGVLYEHKAPARRTPSDYLKTMYRNGRISQRQYEAGKRYRIVFEAASAGAAHRCSPEEVMALRSADAAVLESSGAAALTMLRRVAGEGGSLATLMKGGVSHAKIVGVLTAALETTATFLLDEAA
jgi:hypothetical protein